MRNTYSIILCMLPLFAFAQEAYQMKGNSEDVEVNFLLSYYDQDGDNAAVTGGIGTEELQDYASLLVVNIPLDSIQSLNLSLGADLYSSASTDNIDNIVSSSSSSDMRKYTNIGYARKNLKKGETYGARIGFSLEYDYISINGGLTWTKEWNEGNSELSLNAQAFIDSWDLIYPIEIRSEVTGTIASSNRSSYNLQATYSKVINKRLQMSISGEAIYMDGLLSTPFHRVYFADQTRPDIERLPDTRLKIPVGIRANYFPFDNLIVRSYYRFYWDDFGINAHTMSIETPIKIGTTFTLYPFYRYHTQTAADYFAPFKVHTTAEQFYTSDYDLSALSSHKIGLGFGFSPLYGITRVKMPFSKKAWVMDKLQVRTAYYSRSTGLNSFLVSLDLGFKIKGKK